MSHILAIDQGTSSSRALIVDAKGDVLAIGQRALQQSFPHDGWVEQSVDEIWDTTIAACREALERAGLTGRDIAAVGIANQRETTLVWDADTGCAVYPAIVWQDRRTALRCERIVADGMEDRISEITGLVADPYFSGTKLEWILDQADMREKADNLRFGTIDTYLVWRLTKGKSHVTEASNASRTQLFDINDQTWSEELLDYFHVPRSVLPKVCDSVDEFGVVDAEWFGTEIPILGIAGDQQAALIGQACLESGQTKSTYGTGCFVMTNTGIERRRSTSGLLATVAYRISGETTYALEGSIFSAGVAVQWLRDRLRLIASAAESEDAARRIDGDTGEIYVVPAFTGLGAPHWRPDARGLVTGLTLDASADQIVTATLKSIAFQTGDLMHAIAEDGIDLGLVRVDGGMVANDWFCQFLADILNMPVERPRITETTALGAAILALVGTGTFPNLNAVQEAWQLERRFDPTLSSASRAHQLEGWHRAVQRAL